MRETVCALTSWRRHSGSRQTQVSVEVAARPAQVQRQTCGAASQRFFVSPRRQRVSCSTPCRVGSSSRSPQTRTRPRGRVRQIAGGLECACLSICVTSVKDWWHVPRLPRVHQQNGKWKSEGEKKTDGKKEKKKPRAKSWITPVSGMSDLDVYDQAAFWVM